MFTGNIVTVSNTAKHAYNEVPGMVDIAKMLLIRNSFYPSS